MAPFYTVISHSAGAEGGDLFPALLAHLRRLSTEVHGPVVATGQATESRDFHIGEGEGFSIGTSLHSSIKLGSYAGRLTNLNLAGMNNPSPNLTTVYLDTSLVGPAPDPLEYVPSPGHLG